MIDIFVSLLKTILDAIKSRDDAIGKIQETIVTPLYSNLATIHEDYLKIFEACQLDVKEKSSSSSIARQFLSDRLQQEALRRSLAVFSLSFANDPKLKKYQSFFFAVIDYLDSSKLVEGGTRSEIILESLYRLADTEESLLFSRYGEFDFEQREITIEMVNELLKGIRKEWDAVSIEYAKILPIK